jgi:hypothetical protein
MIYSLVPASQSEGGRSMQNAHTSALEAKHATLDRKIAAESQRPLPDTMILAELKRQKLRLKEEIAR